MAHEPQDTQDRLLDAYAEAMRRVRILEEMLAYTEDELIKTREGVA